LVRIKRHDFSYLDNVIECRYMQRLGTLSMILRNTTYQRLVGGLAPIIWKSTSDDLCCGVLNMGSNLSDSGTLVYSKPDISIKSVTLVGL